ncbi:hypothetical protein F4803DRAFT_521751 [Xylaria telfairii]|nr:hypothetical protein F4803DRAFT_521751 [Xylaria telfairii]
MTPRRMDHESAQRIIKARGQNDSFGRRAEMTARNHDDNNNREQAQGSSENQEVKEEGEKKEDDENTKSESGQDSQDV